MTAPQEKNELVLSVYLCTTSYPTYQGDDDEALSESSVSRKMGATVKVTFNNLDYVDILQRYLKD